MACGILSAQDAYRQLIITEAVLGARPMAYVEISNVGTVTVNLSEFELGKVTPWTGRIGYESGEPLPPLEDWFNVAENEKMMLPDIDLAPGESWVIASVGDWRRGMELRDPFVWRYRESRLDYYEVADYHLHYPELPATPPVKDSVDPKYRVLEVWNGRDCFYLRHHFMNAENEKDSVVIDQVGGVFDDTNGTNRDVAYDVAGIPRATNTHKLIRKATITTGNLEFNLGRGVDQADSEWMPIPRRSPRHPSMWHIGNHGSYVLDANTLESDVIDVDFANAVITVPWGVQRDDSLMFKFVEKPGVAWYYDYVPVHADSAYLSARTGDTLRLIVLGDNLQQKDFHIEVLPPADDANIVVPKKSPSFTTGWFGSGSAYIDNARFRATGGNEVDTIKHNFNIPGIAFNTRVDTLLTYLEKAPNADWEIVWVDDMERVDLKHGDILRVTAENGDVKDYFIKVEDYRPNDNANLDAITWPDIPAFYRGILGWRGDTIPNFSPTVYSYQITVPGDVDGMPALVAKTQHPNATVEVKRASSYAGETENRTVTFTVTAESDTTVRVYSVLLSKEKLPEHVQPYEAEPIISEFIFWEQWNNGMKEIANTGNQPLDLSNYMLVNSYLDGPATAIEWDDQFHNRYRRYIPGYKWTSVEGEWENQMRIAEQDVIVNPIVYPGDVFVIGDIRTYGFGNNYEDWYGATWWVPGVLDIDFGHKTVDGVRTPSNPWGEELVNPENNNWGGSAAREWKGGDFFMFKILNDSIKLGLKPATDPNDFELIEIFGTGDMSEYDPVGNGAPMISSFVRKPEYVFPNPVPKGSFGETPEESEWSTTNQAYWIEQQVGWPQEILYIALGLGTHQFDTPTHYMSTVTSLTYVVSPGFEDEQIRGITTGTTVEQFMGSISKAHADQSLFVVAGADTLANDAVFADGDALHVMSADSTNITVYNLIVTAEGLRSDAILTSATYTIEVDDETGTVSGFEYGTMLKTVRDGVTVPAGATLTIVDDKDAYVPLRRPNFDTIYVDVMVSDKIFFEVVAEDGETKVLYQLLPDSDPSDAFVTSAVYEVDQALFTIDLVPGNSSVAGLLSNLTPSRGATMHVEDKIGLERPLGNIYKDDRVIVTSQDETVTNTYFITFLGDVADYLSYLVSDVYEVNQVTLTLHMLVEESPMVSEMLAQVKIAPGATVLVMNADGTEKAESDMVEDGDIVRVTAADGVTVSEYKVDLNILSVDKITSDIKLYPNPSNGRVFMEGLEPGSNVQVYNIVGVPVFNKVVQNSNEVLSLEDQPAGLYLVVVTNNKEIVGRYKLIIR